MEKGFFKNLFDAAEEIDISIVASRKKDSDSMTVLVTARKKDGTILGSMSAYGTPEDLEEGIFTKVIPVLGEAKKASINIDGFKNQLKEVEEAEKKKVTEKKAKSSGKSAKELAHEKYKELAGKDAPKSWGEKKTNDEIEKLNVAEENKEEAPSLFADETPTAKEPEETVVPEVLDEVHPAPTEEAPAIKIEEPQEASDDDDW